jgi:sodium/potassium-transporting ATPase subunit alpha
MFPLYRQWFNLFAVRTRRLSVLQHRLNYLLIPAIIFSLVVALIFVYPKALNDALATTPAPVEHWFLPMGFGVGILLMDEGRKYLVRNYPQGFLAKIAW